MSSSRKIWVVPLVLAGLGGCVYAREVETQRPAPAPVVMTPAPVAPVIASERVVTYPEGRWQLYGDGTRTPYYWIWIPTGSTLASAPPPPAKPSATKVTDRTYSYPEGRWQLYGDGRSAPYYWVWIPSGAAPPAPPLPPQAG